MAGPYSGGQSQAEASSETMANYAEYLPQLIKVAVESMGPAAKAQLKAAEDTASGWANIDQKETSSKLTSDTNLLKDQGDDYASALLDVQKQFDPEFFKGRETVANSYEDLAKTFNISGGLSDAEAAAVERENFKKNFAAGNGGQSSALTTVGNAMNFGDRYDKKRTLFADTMGKFGTLLPNLKTGFDASGIGSKPIGSGIGAYGSSGSAGMTTANNTLNNMFGMGQSTMNKPTPTQNALSAFTSLVGAVRG